MSEFKVGDRVVHSTKGSATVVSKRADQILLELDYEMGSPFEVSARPCGFPILVGSAKEGNYYWWPSPDMVFPLICRKTFKGNN